RETTSIPWSARPTATTTARTCFGSTTSSTITRTRIRRIVAEKSEPRGTSFGRQPSREHGHQRIRPNFARLFLKASPPALRRLGQRGRAAAAPDPWRAGPLPELGLGR